MVVREYITMRELNYETHDKELLVIVEAFKQWKAYLEGSCAGMYRSQELGLLYNHHVKDTQSHKLGCIDLKYFT